MPEKRPNGKRRGRARFRGRYHHGNVQTVPDDKTNPWAAIPSVDRLLATPALAASCDRLGRALVRDSARAVLDTLRAEIADCRTVEIAALAARIQAHAEAALTPSLRPVFNLTGTVLHTGLGRAALAESAIAAVVAAARRPTNLEYDLARARRGDRDRHTEALILRLTGAEAATVVNNNAAAVLLVLNTFALDKEVPVSRGELVEIGDAFRMPDIMARAGCRLREVGTTNRTHLGDYEAAIGPATGLVMKVHASNYAIEGFTAAVPEAALARLCAARAVPFAVDLGSGSLADLETWGLPHERTVRETLAAGADLVTFSGDKLLGGPQAGVIAGRAELIARLKRNPLKRALRVDKMTVAALSATLALYLDPGRLAERMPGLRQLVRAESDIAALAARLRPALSAALGARARVRVIACRSQIGSGALPVDLLPSRGLAITPAQARGEGAGTALKRLADAFAALPVPVLGRIRDGALVLDLRCLEDEAGFTGQLDRLGR